MQACLFDLPNELILQALVILPTTALLPVGGVCRRFHALVVRLLQTRLYHAANLPDHTLLIECYHPSRRLTEPPLYCTYIGSPGLDREVPHEQSKANRETSHVGRLKELHSLYSVFTPHRRVVLNRPHPAGDIPGSRTHPSSSQALASNNVSTETEAVKQTFSLEGHELFTQICAHANIVRVGPRNGLFRSFVKVEDGVIRVWREWLNRMARNTEEALATSKVSEPYLLTTNKGKEPCSSKTGTLAIEEDTRILWVDVKKNVGLRVKITEKKWQRVVPVLIHADEEISVSYEIEYQGKCSILGLRSCANRCSLELLIRTAHLVLMMERSLNQQENHSGKAVVFGAFGSD
jgi:hypothetical protein